MKHPKADRRNKTSTLTESFAAIGAGALILRAVRFGMDVFGPAQPFYLEEAKNEAASPEGDDFAFRLASVADAILYRDTRIEVLKNGSEFYPAELQAVDASCESINLEAFEFFEGELTTELLRRMAARAKAGVAVRILVDRLGSLKTRREYFAPLIEAGGRMEFYHPINLRNLPYLDHRNHRKLMTVDGRIGFIGGAGFADHWLKETNGKPPWRDTMLRVEGEAVSSLNSAFAENWVATTGEVLFSPAQFAANQSAGSKVCMVVNSTPAYGATQARILFQALIETARKSIQITSPYFLPDRSARHALIRAARNRGVRVQVLTVGKNTDHNSVRYLGQAMAGKMMRAGLEYYEYQPGMMHAKIMTIDGIWVVAGSTNFDYRSFALNSEVNIAICDSEIARIAEHQFEEDCRQSRRLSARDVRPKTLGAAVIEEASWVLRREE